VYIEYTFGQCIGYLGQITVADSCLWWHVVVTT